MKRIVVGFSQRRAINGRKGKGKKGISFLSFVRLENAGKVGV